MPDRDMLPCGYQANGATWVRWAIGITVALAASSLGYEIRQGDRLSKLEQRVSDDAIYSAADRRESKDYLKMEIDSLSHQIDTLTRVVQSSNVRRSSNSRGDQ